MRTIHPDGSMTETITRPTNSINVKQVASGKVIIETCKVYAPKEEIAEAFAVYRDVAIAEAEAMHKAMNPE